MNISFQKVSCNYANAWFEYVVDDPMNITECYNDCKTIEKICNSQSLFVSVLESPLYSYNAKLECVEAVLPNINVITNRLIKLIIENNRANCLCLVAQNFQKLYHDYKHIFLVDVVTAVPIDEKLIDELKIILKKMFKCNDISISSIVDTALIGGYVLRCKGKQYDYSLSSDLTSILRSINF